MRSLLTVMPSWQADWLTGWLFKRRSQPAFQPPFRLANNSTYFDQKSFSYEFLMPNGKAGRAGLNRKKGMIIMVPDIRLIAMERDSHRFSNLLACDLKTSIKFWGEFGEPNCGFSWRSRWWLDSSSSHSKSIRLEFESLIRLPMLLVHDTTTSRTRRERWFGSRHFMPSIIDVSNQVARWRRLN